MKSNPVWCEVYFEIVRKSGENEYMGVYLRGMK